MQDSRAASRRTRFALSDGRRIPFFQIGKNATGAIADHVPPRRVPIARSVYFALVELINDAREVDSIECTRTFLAGVAGVSRSTISSYLDDLVGAGVLVVESGAGDGAANRYTLVDPVAAADTPVAAADGGVSTARTPSSNSSRTTSSSSSSTPQELAEELHRRVDDPEMIADAERLLLAKTKVGTKIVTGEEMVTAAAALTAFNRAQGAKHGLGAYLTPIVGRIRERPTWDAEKHVRLVQSAWRIRWWERNGKGRRATPKVVYGNTACFENVVQDAADEHKGDMAAVEKRRGKYERTRSVEEA